VKTLLLIRHAKSSWDDPQLDDHERPLAERGERAALVVGQYLLQRGLRPDLILSSTAARTRQTADLILSRIGTAPLRFERRLYLAESEALLDCARATSAEIASLAMIGHNPGLHDFARNLAAAKDGSGVERLNKKLPTAGLAVFRFDIDHWRALDFGAGRLDRFVTVKELV